MVLPVKSRFSAGSDFAQTRVAGEVAKNWINRKMNLHDTVTDRNKTRVTVPPQTYDAEPTEEVLKSIPGALDAWRGIHKLELQVCVQKGAETQICPVATPIIQHRNCGWLNTWATR